MNLSRPPFIERRELLNRTQIIEQTLRIIFYVSPIKFCDVMGLQTKERLIGFNHSVVVGQV